MVQNPGDPFTSGDFFPVGVNTITYIATDASSNTNTCSFTITIVDNQLPVITCPATANINTDLGLCTSSASIGTATFTDNCAGGSVAVLPAGPYAIGATNVVWTATDANGNTSSCTQVVNVTDTLAPVITCPATANINTDFGLCTSSASIGTATFTDNCAGGSVAVLPAGPYAIGSTNVVWTATDATGNTSSCTQAVNVTDAEFPLVSCATITVNPTFGVPDTIVAGDVITASSDNCGIASSTVSPNIFTCLQDGQTVPVVVTITDNNGNPTICNTSVNVVGIGCLPNNAPVAICQDVTVNADASCQGTAVAADFNNGSSDPDSDPISFSVLPAGPYSLGTTAVVLTVTDGSLSSTCSANIIVNDATAPTAACANFTANLDFTGNVTITAANIDNGSTDNCGVPTLSLDITSFDCGDVGTPVTVTLTVSDAAGNT
jgi:hypothetical protein